MSAATAQTVGKAALAKAIDWSRPKLDRRLESDPDFPVVSRGDQSGGWQFDPAAVLRYLDGGAVAPSGKSAPSLPAKAAKSAKLSGPVPAAPAIDAAQFRDTVAAPVPTPAHSPRRSADHKGEATAKQRKDTADAALREDKLASSRKELVVRADLRQTLSDVFAALGNDLDGLPEAIVKALNLTEDMAPRLRELVDKVRLDMVTGIEPLLSDD